MYDKIIYIAGPYRAKTEWGLIENIRRAEKVAIECWKKGWVVICPHKNTAHFGGILPDSVWLEGDMEILRRCDAICMVPGWEESVGAKEELIEAFGRGIEVYFNHKDLWPTEEKK